MDELLKQRITVLTPEYQSFLKGDYINLCAEVLGKAEQFDQEQIELLKSELYFYCLFFYSEDDLVEVLASNFNFTTDESRVFTEAILSAFPNKFRLLQNNFRILFKAEQLIDPKILNVAEKYPVITRENLSVFIQIYIEVLNGDLSQTKLPEVLADRLNINAAEALRITADLIDYLSEKNGASTDLSLESEIAETEAALNAIPKIRTMAQDAQESTTHTTSQADLLNKDNRWTPKQ